MTTDPILFAHILAERKLSPGACQLRIDGDDVRSVLPLLSGPDFAVLVSAMPCLLDDATVAHLPEDGLRELEARGCRRTPSADFWRADDPASLPSESNGASWIAGDWYLVARQSASKQSASRALSIKLLELISNDADTREIEVIFREDPVLAYHLLRLVNSIGVGIGRRITSFTQAILILGRQQLKRWLNLMLFAACRDDHRAAMLLGHVTLRARRMELLACLSGLDRGQQEQAFMCGMFSLLGVLFGAPLGDLVAPLNLGDHLASALLRREGLLGEILAVAERCEADDASALRAWLQRSEVSAEAFNRIQVEALVWTLGVIRNQRDSDDA